MRAGRERRVHFARETSVPLERGGSRVSPVLCGQYARDPERLLRTPRPWQVSCRACHKEMVEQTIPGTPSAPNAAGLPLGAAIHPDRASDRAAVVGARDMLETRLAWLEQLDRVPHAPDCQRRAAPGLVSWSMAAGGSWEATAGLREMLTLEARTCAGCELVRRSLLFVWARDRGQPGREEWGLVLAAKEALWST